MLETKQKNSRVILLIINILKEDIQGVRPRIPGNLISRSNKCRAIKSKRESERMDERSLNHSEMRKARIEEELDCV